MGNFVSFYGTDGCGKSTVASKLFDCATTRSQEAIIIGGSSYKTWLSREVAQKYIGNCNIQDLNPVTIEEVVQIYEDIAIACYGLALSLSAEGRLVLVDSDPFLKRAVWGTIRKSVEEANDYLTYFCEKVTDKVGALAAPNILVGLNIDPDNQDFEDLLDRISVRGDVSGYDPKDIDEMKILNSAVLNIWGAIANQNATSKGLKILTDRFSNAKLIELYNHKKSPDKIEKQIDTIVKELEPVVFNA